MDNRRCGEDAIDYADRMAEFLSGPKPSDFDLGSAFHDADLSKAGVFLVPNVEELLSQPTRKKDK